MVPFHLAVIAAAAMSCAAAHAAPAKTPVAQVAQSKQISVAEALLAAQRDDKTLYSLDTTIDSEEFFKLADKALKAKAGTGGGSLKILVEGDVRHFQIVLKGRFTGAGVFDAAMKQADAQGLEIEVAKQPDAEGDLVIKRIFKAPKMAAKPAEAQIVIEPAVAVATPVVAPAVMGRLEPVQAPVVAKTAAPASAFTFTAEGSYSDVIGTLGKQFGLRVAKAAGTEPRKANVYIKTPSFDNLDDLVDYVRKSIDPVELRFNGASKTVQLVFDAKAISRANEQVENLISNDAVELNRRYAAKRAQASTGESGLIQYQVGTGEPVVISSPLKVTDIQLEPGERISNIVAGDTSRWVISTGNSGMGEIIPHVFVKPSDLGLETTAVITTDRRTYTLILRAAAAGHMQRVGFTYPKSFNTALTDIVAIDAVKKAEKAAQEEEKKAALVDAMDPAGLDFNYKINVTSGSPSFVPVRVFSNPKKTVIQFTSLGGEQAPALFSVADDGSLELLNYRWKGSSIVADEKLKRAALVIGIDDKEQRVDIVLDGMSPARKKLFGIF